MQEEALFCICGNEVRDIRAKTDTQNGHGVTFEVNQLFLESEIFTD